MIFQHSSIKLPKVPVWRHCVRFTSNINERYQDYKPGMISTFCYNRFKRSVYQSESTFLSYTMLMRRRVPAIRLHYKLKRSSYVYGRPLSYIRSKLVCNSNLTVFDLTSHSERQWCVKTSSALKYRNLSTVRCSNDITIFPDGARQKHLIKCNEFFSSLL